MNEAVAPIVGSSPRQKSILYEAHSLTLPAGTGIANYARTLAEAAGRLGYQADGLFGVERRLVKGDDRLNEVLAFDAIDEDAELSLLELAWRYMCYPFNAVGGLRPTELSRRGLVFGPVVEALRPFKRVFASTQLVDVSAAHFKIYGRLARIMIPERPALFHATHPVPIFVKNCLNVYTVHDLVPLRLPYTTLDDKKYYYRLLTSIGRTADHIVTVSDYSRRDIVDFLGIDERRVTNTYQAVDISPHLMARSDDEVAKDLETSFGLEFGRYFLFYGAVEPKKNIARLIDAYAGTGTKLPLIIAGGKGWQNKADMRKIRDLRFVNLRLRGDSIRRERQVQRLDYLPRHQLVNLIRGARALLFPSIYEGFGLPVIEAMALGTPVVTSNVSSLPEVAGDAALIVDPYSIDDIARGIRTVEADADLRAALSELGRKRSKNFLPAAYDERLRTLYRELLK